MTEFKQGVAYRTRDGKRVEYIGESVAGRVVFEDVGTLEISRVWGSDIIGEWEFIDRRCQLKGDWTKPDPCPQRRKEDKDAAELNRIRGKKPSYPGQIFYTESQSKPETIDVANMWVSVDLIDGKLFMNPATLNKPDPYDTAIAIIRVKDWHDICQGKRKLVRGEGL